jgi:PPM family protein phosphatase
MKYFEYTNKGNREENQDYTVHGSLPDDSDIFVVADGMGGYSDGAVAAKVVSDAIIDFVELNFNQFTPLEILREAISFANDTLMLKRIASTNQKMGCVITVLLLNRGYAYFTWLGDSRIYMYRNGQEVYRTEDHSVINELAKIKTLSADSYEKYSSIVTKSIMGESPVDEAPVRKVAVEEGDIFILCTDGFHKEIDMMYARNFDESKKVDLEHKASKISDNFSFIKVEI